ncbi:MAG: TrkA family potassium uptake protein [Ruminococcaceae bacterium]|nr:TrkA family potassium uptake protein [Oscillospiraceae bacterium]
MKSFLVIGMGHFGKHLADRLQRMGNEVMIIDKCVEKIEDLAPDFQDAQIGDCTSKNLLKSLDVEDFDVCFVTVGDNFQSSLEISYLLKELGAKCVVAEVGRDVQEKFLLRNGADYVIYPERDMASRMAVKYSANNVFDYIELSPEYGIFEIPPMEAWVGKSIRELDIRGKYGMNVLGVKSQDSIRPMPGVDYVFTGEEHVVVLGNKDQVIKITNKK